MCRMCMGLRGGSYYGASLHISVALLFLGGFFIDLLGISEVWHNPYATYFSLILAFLYICLFLVFGLLIFRGVETESPKLLKGAVAGFLVLQISAFIVYLALLGLTNSRKTAEITKELELIENGFLNETTIDDVNLDIPVLEDLAIITLLQIISLVLGVIITFAYVATVVMYVKSLTGESRRSARH